ncbi:bifunctional DNA-formamidopyrimidine glycosylase/DNA-(apurinic or apyrimidinic site) lyase [Candidatus Saccharibacteria bacterium]|nr:bifunctional DNA-formamidopyrimidine glycosylase/DNA-(apurinic or apyrimidinic site) lyase [Candidatus Saccharibacteria bacterium]
MPELPEVETIRRGLQQVLCNRVIATVDCVDSPKSFPNDQNAVEQCVYGTMVTAVRRRAKMLLIDLSSGYSLVIHLKMTGQLVYRGSEAFGGGHPTDSLIGKLPDRSTRVILTLADGSHLFFNDQRKFGWMKLIPTIEIPNIDFMKKVGPEPLEDSFTPQEFILRVRRRSNTSIKAAILDQTVLAGVGNIYADESLWGAKLHPAAWVRDVTDAQLSLLLQEIKFVMNLSIDKGGSTDRNYVNAEGKRGSYIDFARVFRKEGTPCPRHAEVPIEKIKVAGRGTHICPACQQDYTKDNDISANR